MTDPHAGARAEPRAERLQAARDHLVIALTYIKPETGVRERLIAQRIELTMLAIDHAGLPSHD